LVISYFNRLFYNLMLYLLTIVPITGNSATSPNNLLAKVL